MRTPLTLLVICVVFAGCGGGSSTTPGTIGPTTAPSTPTTPPTSVTLPVGCEPGNSTCPEPSLLLSFGRCQLSGAFIEVPGTSVAGEVPPGYVESGLTGGATVTTSLRVFSCDAMALDNQTIEKGQVFAEVSILVQAPAEAASPDGGDLFMKEFITTSTSLAARLQGLGAPAVVGTVSTTPGPTQAIHVTAPGGVSYDVSGASGDTMGQPVELGLRLHFGPDGLSWLDESGSELAAESTGTGIATTTGGFLGHATQSTGGTASALLFEVPVQGTLAFGKLP